MEDSDKFRDPEQDLPAELPERRHHYYADLAKPLDAADFIDPFARPLAAELRALHDTRTLCDWLASPRPRPDRETAGPGLIGQFERIFDRSPHVRYRLASDVHMFGLYVITVVIT